MMLIENIEDRKIPGRFLMRDRNASGFRQAVKDAMNIPLAEHCGARVEFDDVGCYAITDEVVNKSEAQIEAILGELQDIGGDTSIVIFVTTADPYDISHYSVAESHPHYSYEDAKDLHRDYVVNRIQNLINCLADPSSVNFYC